MEGFSHVAPLGSVSVALQLRRTLAGQTSTQRVVLIIEASVLHLGMDFNTISQDSEDRSSCQHSRWLADICMPQDQRVNLQSYNGSRMVLASCLAKCLGALLFESASLRCAHGADYAHLLPAQ